jgi:regulator of replication initiation timing
VDWLQPRITIEQAFELERVARNLEPREALLYRQVFMYQQQLQAAVWETMRLELELEELRLQLELLHAPLP